MEVENEEPNPNLRTDGTLLLFRQLLRVCPETKKPTASCLLPHSQATEPESSVDQMPLIAELTQKHLDVLSVYQDPREISHAFFTRILNKRSEGVLTISVQNCININENLKVYHQPVTEEPTNPAHGVISFPTRVVNQQRRIASKLFREIEPNMNFQLYEG